VQTYRYIHTGRQADRQTGRLAYIHTDTQTYIQTHTDRQTYIQTTTYILQVEAYREAGRHAGRQTDRQTD